MNKKDILILGSGISGLSAAWYLSSKVPGCKITVLEAKDKAGGWIESLQNNSFRFELGPRMFKASKSYPLLDLIHELGLNDQLQISKSSLDRFVLWKDILHRLPRHPLSLFFHPFTRDLFSSVVMECFRKKSSSYDESVKSFITRRFGSDILHKLIDPITQGIYAADPSEISIRSCFGSLKSLEDSYGSVLIGLLKKKRPKNRMPHISPSSLFTLKGGNQRLIEKLLQKTACDVSYGEIATSIIDNNGSLEVVTNLGVRRADTIFVALPPSKASLLFTESIPEASRLLAAIPSVSITSVLVGFDGDILCLDGFGYLVPSEEKSQLLGVVFDSKVFDDHNKPSTRMTFMFKGVDLSDQTLRQLVRISLKKHLHIEYIPNFELVHRSLEAIPKFVVGHSELVSMIRNCIRKKSPNCLLLGNYLEGVSVSDCVGYSKAQIFKWARRQGVLIR